MSDMQHRVNKQVVQFAMALLCLIDFILSNRIPITLKVNKRNDEVEPHSLIMI